MAVIQLQVRTYSGYQADQRPTSFVLGGRTFRVEEIMDQWYGEDHAYFKLIADDGNLYIIRHDDALDLWELTMTETLRK